MKIMIYIGNYLNVYFNENLMELDIKFNNTSSIRFSPNGGKIILSQYCTKSEVVVCIHDNGCGMSEETIKHIFDKFYQGDTSHSMEGNGLGLALVKRILEIHDGSIEVESKLNEGTTFTIKFPINMLNEVDDVL
ncbi:sensor histidine kinase [Terrisporobacter othiniensis]|uniref:sensor histidine kinase n=1 Tax=Terrisporobacter othiniensis TaxID=1577792 RepID=UPI0009DEF814|nr:sensor histidine kinase [Terrisporobacter othiniensis]